MTESNVKSGFAACGIFPFDPSAVPQAAYLPNSLYTVEQLLDSSHILDTPTGSATDRPATESVQSDTPSVICHSGRYNVLS